MYVMVYSDFIFLPLQFQCLFEWLCCAYRVDGCRSV